MMKTKYIYFLATFLLILFFKFFENSYVILKKNYQLRLVDEYGFCSKTSYGFIKYIDKKYNLKKNVNIINDEIHPSSDAFIHKPNISYHKDYLILLNYNELDSKINLKNYRVIEKIKNCFYLEKND